MDVQHQDHRRRLRALVRHLETDPDLHALSMRDGCAPRCPEIGAPRSRSRRRRRGDAAAATMRHDSDPATRRARPCRHARQRRARRRPADAAPRDRERQRLRAHRQRPREPQAERHQPRRRAHGVQGHARAQLPADQSRRREAGRRRQRPHRQGPHGVPHARPGRATPARSCAMLGDIVQTAPFRPTSSSASGRCCCRSTSRTRRTPIVDRLQAVRQACYGAHPLAQPVIGTRGNIAAASRATTWSRYVERQYTGANVVVGAAGNIDVDAVVREAEAAFGAPARAAARTRVDAPAYIGGVGGKALGRLAARPTSCSAIRCRRCADDAPRRRRRRGAVRRRHELAAARRDARAARPGLLPGVLGRRARDRRPVRHRGVDRARARSTSSWSRCARLLAAQADAIARADLERARNQIAVRRLRAAERPARRLEDAALDLLALGRVRSRSELAGRIAAVGAADVRSAFTEMLRHAKRWRSRASSARA